MNDKWLLEKILSYVEEYCESSDDFLYIINNIKQMKENFEEEHEEDKDEDPVCYVKPWEKY